MHLRFVRRVEVLEFPYRTGLQVENWLEVEPGSCICRISTLFT